MRKVIFEIEFHVLYYLSVSQKNGMGNVRLNLRKITVTEKRDL